MNMSTLVFNDDLEKGVTTDDPCSPDSSAISGTPIEHSRGLSIWHNFRNKTIKSLEQRGVERVLSDERQIPSTMGYVQMSLLWFSMNLTANNLALGLLGPLVYQLSFLDSALCSVFGAILGSACAAYMSTWGPISGNRTMIVARYFMGYYPGKICALLNIVIMLGYGMINAVVGGQILSAVANGRLSIIAGILINCAVTGIVATFGMSMFHLYERWAWVPQLIVLFILVGSAGPAFDTTFPSVGDPATIIGNRLSFITLCFSAPATWAPSAADYYVYYPETTSRWKTFALTLLGLSLSFSFINLLGVGLASGTFSTQSWADAYAVSPSALIVAGYNNLGGFGRFCSVIVSLGVIANNIPGTYSAAISMQVMGRQLARLPRWFLTCVCVLIYTACALGGRNNLFDIFENFLALMGYWVAFFIAIVVEEQYLFRRHQRYDWTVWKDWRKLPLGIAALTAFLVGWAGAVLCMDQVYFVGPIAKMVGDDGGDLGIWVGAAWTLLVYPPLRALELKVVGR